MKESFGKYFYRSAVLILSVILVIMGIDIEIKLNRLSSVAPVVVYENKEVTGNTDISEYIETTADTTDETTIFTSVTATDNNEQPTSSNKTADTDITLDAAELTESFTSNALDSEKADEDEKTTHQGNTDQSYYVTASGKKYHISTCGYLSKSKIKITMEEILSDGYEPCSRCIKNN